MDDTADLQAASDRDAVVVDVRAEVVRATGSDRVAFLHRLLTGDVAGTAAGAGSRSLLLNLKGHIVSEMRVFVAPDQVRLVVAAEQGAPTVAALSAYAIMDDFTAAVDPALLPLALLGPGSEERLAAAGVSLPAGWAGRPAWSHDDAQLGGEPLWVVRARGLGRAGSWVFSTEATRLELLGRLAAAGVRRLAPAEAEVLRIESGEPLWGAEITAEYFPMEIGLGGAIDYGKGCYLGQEPIVRIRDRGHINWRLVRLEARDPGAPLPSPGDALESDLKPRAGRVTSAAQRPGAAPVALAVLHVSVPVGTEVRIRHGEALVPALALEAPLPP
jgi:folate-binding protein YgfZ